MNWTNLSYNLKDITYRPQLLLLHYPNISLSLNYLEIMAKIDLILKSYLYSILNELKHTPSTPYHSNFHYCYFQISCVHLSVIKSTRYQTYKIFIPRTSYNLVKYHLFKIIIETSNNST